jgi:CheY-like chemotaxis protein
VARQPAAARRRAPSRAGRRRRGPPPRAACRPRVLVVDDEASIRDLLSKTLALAEYDVDAAPDGRSALERMRLYPYDLLIADLKMPGMDGLAVIREAKRYKPDLPVIIITGFSTESSADRGGQPRRRRLSHQAVPRAAGAVGGGQALGE